MKDRKWYEKWKKELKKEEKSLHKSMHGDAVKYFDTIRTKKHLEEIIQMRFRTVISQMAREMAEELTEKRPHSHRQIA